MKQRFRTGGIAAWAIRRPVATLMLTLTVIVLGVFSLHRLNIDLLPHIIYPEIRVRINDPGVPAQIIEDTITRQLEEQLAITEDAIAIQSTSAEGRSSVDLSFPYGKDIDIALRDASTRLDRAKRFLPNTIDPPIIYKRDPSQIPVLELAVSSSTRNNIQLRDFADYEFSRWFINLPGVAAAEVGGGQVREIHIIIDQERLANLGLDLRSLAQQLEAENRDAPGGRITLNLRELNTRAIGRFRSIQEIENLPLRKPGENGSTPIIRLRDIARVIDTHEDERLRVRLNGTPGIKLSIQKQPSANTVAVVDAVNERLAWLNAQQLIPEDIRIARVDDQSTFIRHALRNAGTAALSGAVLAMLVVYIFLGDLRRTLIIGTAIPLSIVVTFILMSLYDLTLNIMTLGGLALGVGMVVDSTIVMLENISRHQATNSDHHKTAVDATGEVTSAIVASTSTNLAAILPFLFIGGLIGLLFSELIFTLTAAMIAALVVSITVVPALAANFVRPQTSLSSKNISVYVEKTLIWLYAKQKILIHFTSRYVWYLYTALAVITVFSLHSLLTGKADTLPKVDQGIVNVKIDAESGIDFSDMDRIVRSVEAFFSEQVEVDTVFTTSGGSVFGRTEIFNSNVAQLKLQLKRGVNSESWITKMRKDTAKLKLVGKKIRLTMQSVRGIRTSRGDDDISIRISGTEISKLKELGDILIDLIRNVSGLRNLAHNYQDITEEVSIAIDRDRAAALDISILDVSNAMRVAMEGLPVREFIDGDRQYDIRLRLPRASLQSVNQLGNLLIAVRENTAVRLHDVATLHITPSPATIKREQQRRIVEVSATLNEDADIRSVTRDIEITIQEFRNNLPAGYTLYDGGSLATLQEGERIGYILGGLALFLVFVVMAVQYESLRDPLIIIITVPFTLIGVWLGLTITNTSMSMPVWLGIIMLAGIVVNNAIVLVEQIEIERERGIAVIDAVYIAARLRLRPILMTTLTTVIGLLPLSLGLGEGAEMLQPLAIVIVAGLLFATVISLLLVPAIYQSINRR